MDLVTDSNTSGADGVGASIVDRPSKIEAAKI